MKARKRMNGKVLKPGTLVRNRASGNVGVLVADAEDPRALSPCGPYCVRVRYKGKGGKLRLELWELANLEPYVPFRSDDDLSPDDDPMEELVRFCRAHFRRKVGETLARAEREDPRGWNPSDRRTD